MFTILFGKAATKFVGIFSRKPAKTIKSGFCDSKKSKINLEPEKAVLLK